MGNPKEQEARVAYKMLRQYRQGVPESYVFALNGL